jgi:hypothetical protein
VNTFTPEKRGQVKGELFATARINGAGTTGASLRKSLVGTAHFSLTNMNLQAVGPKTKRLLTPIALVLRVPEIEDSPLDFITADSKMGSGRIDLENTLLKSPAFVGTANGNIQVAEVLTNSPLDIPVGLALRRSLAEKAKVMPANAPPDADYVALPQFAKVIGTVGDPKTDVDKTKIAGLLAGSIGGAVGGKAGDILQGAGGLLKGEKPALGGVLTNLLQKPKSDGKTNTPPKASPLDILRGLAPKQ